MDFVKNPQLDIAFNYVHYTNKNIFLTGKAGTGKTTFLHQVKKETSKRMVIVAPTGVAAINAGGVTIHSFFQLPFGPYIPGAVQDPTKQRKFVREKIRLIQSMDLLVIDEISMVRADVLDAIDDVLRRYKNHFQPFGGVQLLMIGDLHQLPPVVKDDEWEMLREHYDTAYFFGSRALRKTEPVAIELKHIYRQSDTFFIDLLNKVRNNHIDSEVLAALNSRYIADFQPTDEEAYITLSSHNATAQEINIKRLAMIDSPVKVYSAKIDGDFPSYSYPTDEVVEFKVGAQVMFVKNDISKEKLYYNGKIGKIVKISNDNVIYVQCPNEPSPIAVSTVEWKNLKFTLDESTKEINEEIIGSFIQYPLKLAWAITIHKSQGLTFERAIIDANLAFAHGQVYVALSRCKSFEGLVLRSKISSSSIKTDLVVRNYSENAERNIPDEGQLREAKRIFQQDLVLELFNFKTLNRNFDYAYRILLENDTIINASAIEMLKTLWDNAQTEVFSIAEKFEPQIQSYFGQSALPEENEQLQARIQKASVYFQDKIKNQFFQGVQNIAIVTDNKAVRKSILEALETLEKGFFAKNACFAVCETAFEPLQYLRAKNNAELDFEALKKSNSNTSAGKSFAPKDALHPELYIALKTWRDNTAADREMEEYMVLPSRSLLDLCNALPRNTSELKAVKGIGVAKVKQFGTEMLAIIDTYCAEHNITTQQSSIVADFVEKAAKLPKPDTKKVSFELFKAGKTIEEIAAERGLTIGTIEGHLGHFIVLGELDISTLISQENLKEISDFLEENKTNLNGLSDIFTHFNGKYTYAQLRLVNDYLSRT
jgi:hypothetical protein